MEVETEITEEDQQAIDSNNTQQASLLNFIEETTQSTFNMDLYNIQV